jgi:hypothetical protein
MGKCKDCFYWDKEETVCDLVDENWREFGYDAEDGEVYIEGTGVLKTGPDFGCINFVRKE